MLFALTDVFQHEFYAKFLVSECWFVSGIYVEALVLA